MNTMGDNRFRSWLPPGFDFRGPWETRRQLELATRIRELLSGKGFQEVVPPTFDFARTFQLTNRSGVHSPLFELRGSAGDRLAVRSDLTVQVIKAAANGRVGSGFPARFAYLQPVFQDRDWGSGLAREYLQAGVEIIGEDGSGRVREVLELAVLCLQAAGVDCRVVYGDVRIVEAISATLPQKARPEFSTAFYNKDSAALKRLAARCELSQDMAKLLVELPFTFGGPDILPDLRDLARPLPALAPLIEEASAIANVIYDFSLVRELSYYTGPVFEAYLVGHNERIFTGGVYDDLFGEFADESKPACGFALNLTVLVENTEELNRGKES